MTGISFSGWLDNLGWIRGGDCVYVISDVLELAKIYREQGIRINMNDLIDRLQKMTGPSGTLLFPAFNRDFCKGVPFDYRRTPAQTGALSRAALKRPDFTRTSHPLYSFAVWGSHREELMGDSPADSFGPGTVFDKMTEWNAVILVIGLPPLQGVAYIHHVEQTVGVPYRCHREFTADYTDAAGRCEKRTCRMYVCSPDMNPAEIDGFAPLAVQMQADGMILSTEYYDRVPCHFMRVRDVYDAVSRDILENDSRKLYTYQRVNKPVGAK